MTHCNECLTNSARYVLTECKYGNYNLTGETNKISDTDILQMTSKCSDLQLKQISAHTVTLAEECTSELS